MARGLRNSEIAKELFISENTVKNHVRNILEKAAALAHGGRRLRGPRAHPRRHLSPGGKGVAGCRWAPAGSRP
ncbi:hypothetical protein GCM10025868_37040 [Angustibacter aerolatus]|uniref:HTH luxR-type domain-containing protein n=1 Tax=Angustibacter aerolatus TaxID=1162965 RepID=A0ABQ6JKQ3_9ACTN|nr:LuxR C-terminal-related transcriptional regulator [Angustibacter aerolatus]GMA88454.1 hypothetical protein GCM10025868_37040 [Angustibacter aerolatus]